MSCLIIFNLPNTITKIDLMKTFSQKGNVTNIQIIFDAENEYCYFALITFRTEEEAKTAQKHLNKTYLCASRIQIERCREIGQSSVTNQIEKGIYFTQLRNEHICQKKLYKLKSSSNITKLSDQVPKPAKKTTKEFCTSVSSILNKITHDNVVTLAECFRALPIYTVERLEKIVDLIFEKAIEEQCFVPLYAALCSAMQSVQVSSRKGGNKTTFKKLIISKCQSLFQFDKAQVMEFDKRLSEINSCKDPEKKKVLQLEFEENERRLQKLHKRSIGNCRLIGELFKQKILSPINTLYCIVNLVTKHEEEPLECLCNLLTIVGKELEQSYNLNDTFDKLKHLTSIEMESKIPLRIRIMIQDVIDLRRDKWILRCNNSKPKLVNEIENDANNKANLFNRPVKKQRDHHRDVEKFKGGEGHDNRDHNCQYFMCTHGYILVYNITSRKSFEVVKIIREKVLNTHGIKEVPIFLVGNKKDLYAQRVVTEVEGRDLANLWKAKFFEVSAKQNEVISNECYLKSFIILFLLSTAPFILLHFFSYEMTSLKIKF